MAIRAAVFLALFASAGPRALVPQQTDLTSPAENASRARVEVASLRAQIGEPIDMTIVVEHPEGANVVLPDPATLPRSLALVRDFGLRRHIDPAAAGRRITRARWQVMALEGGDLEVPPLSIVVEDGGIRSVVEAALPELAIQTALAEGEDAPRPAKGFRDAPDVRVLSLRGVITFAMVVAAAVVAFIVWRRRARAKPILAPAPPALEQLAALEMRVKSEPDAARELVYALTRIVRSAVDTHVGAQRGSLTDEDWSRNVAADERVPEAVRRSVTQLLSAAERVKYAQETPSSLGLREWITQARAALESLDGTRRQAA